MYTKDSTKPLHLCSQKPERTILKKSPDSKDAPPPKSSKAPKKAEFFSWNQKTSPNLNLMARKKQPTTTPPRAVTYPPRVKGLKGRP